MRFFPIPFADPVTAFAPWADEPWAMLLDSAGSGGRYAFLAVRPIATILNETNPFTALEQLLAVPVHVPDAAPLPFIGGAVGVLGYEAGRHLERAPARHGEGMEAAFGLYDVVAGYDLHLRTGWVVASTEAAEDRAKAMAQILSTVGDLPPPAPLPGVEWDEDLSETEYRNLLRRIIDYIQAGDVFQVNLTHRFIAACPPDLKRFDLYRHLRAANPAPFAAFLNCGSELTLASASPERFLSLDRLGAMETRPIKGTRRRHPDAAADAAAAAELAASVKDRAENLMICDLLRNDLGRVAEIGSIKVPQLCGVESFATLHHLVSVVRGQLRAGLGPVDLLRASFPGGSITGAPKVRAMEIIDELEPAPRGLYCGAVGWIGFDGAMDTSIVIRSLTITKEHIIAQAGGGIVADSDPWAEMDEMRSKAAPALSLFGNAKP